PRQSARAIIPTVITQIVSGCNKIKLGALHPTRDFNYVWDTVAGFIAVAEAEETIGEVINCGSNYEITMGDTVKLIAELMETEIDIEIDKERLRPNKSEVERLWADNSKLERLTGFKPTVNIRDGLKKAIDWFSESENIKQYKANIYNV
ncbi:GDP-mannose 4,6-dehydratase, partial [bacterium]|nr:GDP-mannose 4,6-dehydratase [bacterium]